MDSNKQVAFLGFSADSQSSRENINEGGRTSIQVPKRLGGVKDKVLDRLLIFTVLVVMLCH